MHNNFFFFLLQLSGLSPWRAVGGRKRRGCRIRHCARGPLAPAAATAATAETQLWSDNSRHKVTDSKESHKHVLPVYVPPPHLTLSPDSDTHYKRHKRHRWVSSVFLEAPKVTIGPKVTDNSPSGSHCVVNWGRLLQIWTECEAALRCCTENVDRSLPCRLSQELPPLEATSFFLLLFHCEEATGKLNLQRLIHYCHSYTKAPFEREKSGGLILIF